MKAGETIDGEAELVSLEPFRASIASGAGKWTAVGGAGFQLSVDPRAGARLLRLDYGRLLYRNESEPSLLELVQAGGRTRLEVPPGVTVGFQKLPAWEPGRAGPPEAAVVVHVPEGSVTAGLDGGEGTTMGPGRFAVRPDGAPGAVVPETPEPWLRNPQPSPLEQEVARQFERYFRPNMAPAPNLVEASGDAKPEVRRLGLAGLAAIGKVSLLVEAMSTPGNPDLRREAIAELRRLLARDPSGRDLLVAEFRRMSGGTLESDQVLALLAGTPPGGVEGAPAPAVLIELLRDRDLALRELALDNLRTLTGRGDDLGYDADTAPEDAVRAWQDAVEGRPARPAPARPAASPARGGAEKAARPASPAEKGQR
jgi:hypothetical protein